MLQNCEFGETENLQINEIKKENLQLWTQQIIWFIQCK